MLLHYSTTQQIKLARYMCHDTRTQQVTYNDSLLTAEAAEAV